jgi:hypothetical protein
MKTVKFPLLLAGIVLLCALAVGIAGAGDCCPDDGCCPPPCPPPPCPPPSCCCWFTGGGTIMTIDGINGRQSFGGNAMTMKDKPVRGEWEHINHTTGDIFHGKVTYLSCWETNDPGPSPPKADPNYIEFGGEGVLNHVEGYSFEVTAYDSGEPATKNAPGDHYWITILDPSGAMVVEEDGALSGNFQIHPPNKGHPCD